MNSNRSKLSLSVLATVAMLGAPMAFADNHLFVKDPYNRPVKDPFGRCIITRGGTDFPECTGVAAVTPPPEPTVSTMTLSADAFFDFDKSDLKPAGRASLDQLVADLNRVQQVNRITVVGHTDSIGTDAYNQGLSERRAATVRDYLVSRGVNPAIVSSRGEGERNPVASNATAEGRAQNRRVEVTIEAQQ